MTGLQVLFAVALFGVGIAEPGREPVRGLVDEAARLARTYGLSVRPIGIGRVVTAGGAIGAHHAGEGGAIAVDVQARPPGEGGAEIGAIGGGPGGAERAEAKIGMALARGLPTLVVPGILAGGAVAESRAIVVVLVMAGAEPRPALGVTTVAIEVPAALFAPVVISGHGPFLLWMPRVGALKR